MESGLDSLLEQRYNNFSYIAIILELLSYYLVLLIGYAYLITTFTYFLKLT